MFDIKSLTGAYTMTSLVRNRISESKDIFNSSRETKLRNTIVLSTKVITFANHTIWYGLWIMNKVDKKQWFVVGLNILEKDGFARITIDNLCTRLEITKGAFYHHFKNIDGYIEALMKYWLNQNTVQIIEDADKLATAKERMEFIGSVVINRSHKSEQVIRAWSFSNQIVKKYIQQVDDLRIDYSTKLRVQLGMSEEESKNTSVLEYAIFVGIQQLYPDINKKDLEQLYMFYCQKLQINGVR